MAGEKRFTRIPPESTGDRVYMIHTAEIEYKTFNSVAGGTTDHVWQIGERYDITNFGGNGKVHVHGVFDRGNGTGILAVHYNKTAKFENFEPAQNENISFEDEGVVAQVQSWYDVYIPAQNIMGYDNPEYGWDIDRFGSGRVTFFEGNPQLTGMGSLKTNDAQILASYDFSKSNLPGEFVSSREGGSGVSNVWDAATRSVKLTVGQTQGDRVTQTSNLFHSYEEGASMLFIMSARVGDAGKQDVTRLWGAFDATDGFFFQVKGSDDNPGGRTTPTDPIGTGPGSTLRVVHRFTFDGVTNNHEIVQKEWNQDTFLGTGGASNPSGLKLDISKINAYWIDYQFIGGGRTRWGVFFQGDRLVCHEMYHHNGIGVGTQNTHPLSNPNRPVCFAQANYGAGSPSSSEFFAYGAGVLIEAVTDPLRSAQQISDTWATKHFGRVDLEPYWRTGQTNNGRSGGVGFPANLKSGTSTGGSSSLPGSDSTQYHGSLSPIQFLSNGDENHSVYQPLTFEVSSYDIKTGNPVPVEIRLFYGCVNRGYEFNNPSVSTPTVLLDTEADHMSHIRSIGEFVVSGDGLFRFDELSDNFQYGTVRNLSDQNLARALQPITAWTSSDVYSTGNSPILITVGPDPVFGESKFSIFADKQPVAIRETDGDQDVATVLGTTVTGIKTAGGSGYASVDQTDNPNDWHYLKYVSRNTGQLYASIADIDDDRLTRVLTVSDCSNLELGDKLTVTADGSFAWIMKIDVDPTNKILATGTSNAVEYQILKLGNTDFTAIGATRNVVGEIFTATGVGTGTGEVVATSNIGDVAIVGRSAAQANYTGAFTTLLGGAGNITSATTDDDLKKDYWTSLNALTYTDLGMGADVTIGSGLALYANPNPRAAWTFMARLLDDTTEEDSEGDIGPDLDNIRLNWSIYWRERTQ